MVCVIGNPWEGTTTQRTKWPVLFVEHEGQTITPEVRPRILLHSVDNDRARCRPVCFQEHSQSLGCRDVAGGAGCFMRSPAIINSWCEAWSGGAEIYDVCSVPVVDDVLWVGAYSYGISTIHFPLSAVEDLSSCNSCLSTNLSRGNAFFIRTFQRSFLKRKWCSRERHNL